MVVSMRWKKSSKTEEPENLDKAYEYAVFLLSLKLRTIGEVVRKMQSRGYTEHIIEQTIEQLKERKYLDDERYAEIFLENLKMYKNFGYYGIKKKFIEKKLPPQLIERILQEGLSLKEEQKIAERFLKKEGFEGASEHVGEGLKPSPTEELHYRTFSDDDQNKEKMRMANRLKSRGFRGEVIGRLLF
jgi:SOS response regulatory protein OraA/RecX